MNFNKSEEPDNEDMWKDPPFSPSNDLHSGLHDFESTLRCGICREFFTIPVSLLPCHHSFCSECIRGFVRRTKTGMKRCASCPTCRQELPSADESKFLIPNRTVETLVKKYSAVRSALRDSLASQVVVTADENEQPTVQQEEQVDGEDDVDSKQPAVQEEQQQVEPKRRRTTRSSTSSSSVSATSTLAVATCNTKPQSPQEVTQRLKKRPSTHYKALKKKDLVKLCADDGLATTGNERELQNRHYEFIKLYNAECDSYHPRTPVELAKQVMKRERDRKNESNSSQAHASALERLKKNRKEMGKNEALVGGTAKSGNAQFDEKLKTGFDELLKKMARPTKRKWVDDTPQHDVSVADASERASEQKPAAAVDTESVPTNNANEPHESTDTARPFNPYATAATLSAQKKSANDKVPPPSVSATKAPNPNDAAPPPVSARKPSRSSGLMTSFVQVSTPAATRRPSLSQQSTNSATSIGPWVCQRCTFYNEQNKWSRAKCQICQMQRLAPGAEPPPKEENNMVLLDV